MAAAKNPGLYWVSIDFSRKRTGHDLHTLYISDSDYYEYDAPAIDSQGRFLFTTEESCLPTIHRTSIFADIVPGPVPEEIQHVYSLPTIMTVLEGKKKRDSLHELLDAVIFLLDCLDALERFSPGITEGAMKRVLVDLQLHITINTRFSDFLSSSKLSRVDVRDAFLCATGMLVSHARLV